MTESISANGKLTMSKKRTQEKIRKEVVLTFPHIDSEQLILLTLKLPNATHDQQEDYDDDTP